MVSSISFPRPFEVRLRSSGDGRWTLELVGPLDTLTAPVLAVAWAGVPPTSDVVLDASELTSCDTDGARALVTFAGSSPGRRVELRHPADALIEVLRSFRLPPELIVNPVAALGDRLDALCVMSSILRADAARLRDESAALRIGIGRGEL